MNNKSERVAVSSTIMTLPTAPFDWQQTDVLLLMQSWRSTMELLAKNTPIKSEEYRYCLKMGKEVMLLKMLELNFSTTYVKLSDYSETYSLNWKDVPHFMTKFLQQLETVFTGNEKMKIRNKILAPAVDRVSRSQIDMGSLKKWTAPMHKDAVVYNETFWKPFRWVFPVKIWQQFIGVASLIASWTIKASQEFFRVLNPNILNFFRQIPSPKSPKDALAVGVATSTENVLLPEATEHWNRDDIKTLYNECQSAMKLLENNPAIKSEKYKQ